MARINVIGQSGTGKSYYAGYLLEQIVPNCDYAIHFDVEDEERGLSSSDHSIRPIYGEKMIEPKHLKHLDWPKMIHNHRKLRIVPDDLGLDGQRELYARLCQAMMKLCKRLTPDRRGLLSCDEAGTLLTQHNFDSRVERMVTGGRKHGVECLHISQRPQSLHTTVISQSDQRIYFRISDNNDIKKINKTANFPAKKLKYLQNREFIAENKATGEWDEKSSNNCERVNPHLSGDDGIADEFLPV